MSILNYIPTDVISIVALIIICYLIYVVHTYKRTILIAGLIAVLGYFVYVQWDKKQLTNEVAQVKEQLKMNDGFARNTLGYSLNNPGNIRKSSTQFPGEVDSPQAFKKFSSMQYGFCAMATLLHRYVNNGYNTIDKIINRYAPASDGNNPKHYAATVAKQANVKIDKVLSETDFSNGNMLNIMYAMTKVEQGYAPNIRDLYEGYNMFERNR